VRGFRRLTHGAYTVGSLTVVLDDNDHVLLVKCRHNSLWDHPGGFKKRAETADAAAHRELCEETGLENQSLHFHGHLFQRAARHIDFVFSTTGTREKFEARASGLEVTDIEWVPLPDAPPRLSLDAQRALALATQGIS
jgi:8-oxo-dGTP diphosphatase